jgi:hypothetical protein
MKTVCLINGSLRGKKASSFKLLSDIESRLPDGEYAKTTVRVKARPQGGYPPATLRQLAAADALVLVFPLYSYALPGALMRLLEDYYAFVTSGDEYKRGAKVYAIVNCGFPRPVVFDECVRVLKNFCRRLSLDWRFAICISAGPVVVATEWVPLVNPRLKKGLAAIASDLESGGRPPVRDYFVRPVLPAPFCLVAKRWVERKMDMR